MNDTRDDEFSTRRPSRTWVWILGLCLLIFGVGIAAFQGIDTAPDTPRPTFGSRPFESPTPNGTPSPSATTNDLGQGTFDSPMVDYLTEVLNSQNTAVLAQSPTFSNPVTVVTAQGSSPQTLSPQTLTPEDAVQAMQTMFTALDPNPWDVALSDAALATYRTGPYGDYFPAGAIVATSHDGHVVSFIGNDSTITTMFMAASEDLLH